MDEDVGVKATTRLRRRMSVEQSEDSSPAPSTPTKKRGGRLAAKPQLELIDENTPVSSPRKTRRKSLATEVEEKPVTPSRRSTRIKSNSSIVSETHSIQATDSPRAKRAARRNSQAGSDNEGPATPARQTRRTRKDSASSVENQESSTLARPLPVAEMVIEEEPENEVQKAINISKSSPTPATDELSPNNARKSKRLLEKKSRRSGSHNCSSSSVEENKSLNITTQKENTLEIESKQSRSPLNRSEKSKESNENLSDSNMSLLKNLGNETKLNTSKHNKSLSSVDTVKNDKPRRNRTESWPAVRTPVANDSVNCSDSELSKKRREKSDNIKSLNTSVVNTDANSTETKTSLLDTSSKRMKKLSEASINANDDTPQVNKTDSSVNEKNTSQSYLDTSSKRKKRHSEALVTKDSAKPEDIPDEEVLPNDNIANKDKEPLSEKSGNADIVRDLVMLFDSAPGTVQAKVYFEDSDSNGVADPNSVGTDTNNKIRHLDSEDQCVPVIKHDFQENMSPKDPTEISAFPSQVDNDKESYTNVNIPKVVDGGNDSCEPMDIDETINEEILQKSFENFKQECKSVSLFESVAPIEETDKSQRKSSILNMDTSDRSKNENKSTLILSQIKDVSSMTENTKSPKKINEVLSKTDLIAHEDNNNKISKGNLSLNDLKGTPKQNAIQKLTMQTSTPIITQQLDVKKKTDEENLSTKQSKSDFSKSINDEDSSDNETSREKSKLLDDEAEEASDNYESGDSQDEEERRYAAENEIVDRGETLTSDEDVSNDTDYEKDSFIVSSDAEDNELLSGSGDDLSMSDNELSMSKKSKKKFNERKEKEQKKASREMFESRHKLNTSDEKSRAKIKKNRMRIDSSLLASDEEVVVKPKKNNRMRLDSTLDTNVQHDDTNISQKKSKEKNKSLQDSTQDASIKQDQITDDDLDKSKKNNKSKQKCTTIDEKEITVCNESATDNTDPLQIPVKLEPKTPQKDLNISVVQFTDREEIENVHVSENTSIMNQTNTDPLHTTNACEDSSDSSENEEIMQNYDSVLDELNKDTKTKLSNNNVSLITGNTSKKSRVEPIIDQLNLTQTKNPRKNNNSENVLDSKTTTVNKQDSDNEDSSNSIDLQLLFSEDNCGSDDEQVPTNKPKENKTDNDDDDMFIPLKKSPGKTNIRECIGMDMSRKGSTLNKSSKKKKRKSSLGPVESMEEQEMNLAQLATTLNESSKKKNKRKSSLVPPETDEEQDIYNKSINVNVSMNVSGIKKKKKHSISEPAVEEALDISIKSKDVNVSLNESVTKKKKKHSISEPAVAEAEEITNPAESVLNESSKSKKKKRKSSLAAQDIEPAEEVENTVESVLNKSNNKKKKRKSSLAAEDIEPAKGELFFIDTAGTQGDNKEVDGEFEEPALNVLYERKKKKKKNKLNISGNKIEENGIRKNNAEEPNAAITPKNENKKKKLAQKLEKLVYDEDSDGAPDEAPYHSVKATDVDLQNTENNVAETSSHKKKKKKKKKTSAASNQSAQSIDPEDKIPSDSKKRKRKFSNAEGSHDLEDVQNTQETGTVNDVAGRHKKKRKISYNDDSNTSPGVSESNHVKKNEKNCEINFQNTVPALETTEAQLKKSKKRKHRDEDGDSNQTKVSKENSFQEVHVPRLPDSILNQLDDKPRKSGAVKVISTTNFIVENARQKRAKPSNYLEESVYLDANSPLPKKEKSRIKKPKVLPFTPTASISDSGFTTNFKINKLSYVTTFEAEPVYFSKETYLQKKKIKRLGTYDRYKKQIHHKMSKF